MYSYGFRNPFRVNWDDELGLIITEPMFTSKAQEVEVAVSGGNFGYPEVHPRLPGSSCYESATATVPLPECVTGPAGQEFQHPVVEFPGQIASGAVAYRGTAIPELAGKVLVADWSGTMYAAIPGPSGERWLTESVEVELPEDVRWTGRYLWTLEADAAG